MVLSTRAAPFILGSVIFFDRVGWVIKEFKEFREFKDIRRFDFWHSSLLS